MELLFQPLRILGELLYTIFLREQQILLLLFMQHMVVIALYWDPHLPLE